MATGQLPTIDKGHEMCLKSLKNVQCVVDVRCELHAHSELGFSL